MSNLAFVLVFVAGLLLPWGQFEDLPVIGADEATFEKVRGSAGVVQLDSNAASTVQDWSGAREAPWEREEGLVSETAIQPRLGYGNELQDWATGTVSWRGDTVAGATQGRGQMPVGSGPGPCDQVGLVPCGFDSRLPTATIPQPPQEGGSAPEPTQPALSLDPGPLTLEETERSGDHGRLGLVDGSSDAGGVPVSMWADRPMVGAGRVNGTATYYHPSLAGELMASGDRYNPWDERIAASNDYPLGTVLRITYTKSILVVVQDRGLLAVGQIDLSQAGFVALVGSVEPGRISVEIASR